MRTPSCHHNERAAHRRVGLCVLTLGSMVVLGLGPVGQSPLFAAERPDKGGTVIWAVHEGMPDFDPHYTTSYILQQPVGPLFNGLLTQDVYKRP